MKILVALQALLMWVGPEQRPKGKYVRIDMTELGKVIGNHMLTCLQNYGIITVG